MIKNGKNKQLSELEKGRLIIKFMNKKNDPFKNRQFYDHFFKEQAKAEKIQILEDVSAKIKYMFIQEEADNARSGKKGNAFQQKISQELLEYLQ